MSPSMYSLWIYEGYGNPNFLFFQNIAFTLSHIFFLVEYTRSAMKQRKDISGVVVKAHNE